MSYKNLRHLASIGLAAFALTGCQQFFTSSVAKILARPPATLSSISADDAAALVAAKPNQALAASAVGALASLVTSNPTASVVSNAAQIAVTATGIDTALTQALGSISASNLQSGSLSTTDRTTIANLVSSTSGNVNASTTTIFDALATQAATSPSTLVANGVSSQTLVVAAAAVALNDIKTTLAQTNSTTTLADVIAGTAPAPALSASAQASIANLKAGITAIDPANQTLSLMTSAMNVTI